MRKRAAPRRSRGLAAAALCAAPTSGGPTTPALHARMGALPRPGQSPGCPAGALSTQSKARMRFFRRKKWVGATRPRRGSRIARFSWNTKSLQNCHFANLRSMRRRAVRAENVPFSVTSCAHEVSSAQCGTAQCAPPRGRPSLTAPERLGVRPRLELDARG